MPNIQANPPMILGAEGLRPAMFSVSGQNIVAQFDIVTNQLLISTDNGVSWQMAKPDPNIPPPPNASSVPLDPVDNLTATNVQAGIEQLEMQKVNITDIADDLITANPNVPLSANQGVAINSLIEGLSNQIDGISQNYAVMPTRAALNANSPDHTQFSAVYVTNDETQGGATTKYVWSGTAWVFLVIVNEVPRNFVTNPINIVTESSGSLPATRISGNLPIGQVSGQVPFAQLPTGTGATQVAVGNHTHTPAQLGASSEQSANTLVQRNAAGNIGVGIADQDSHAMSRLAADARYLLDRPPVALWTGPRLNHNQTANLLQSIRNFRYLIVSAEGTADSAPGSSLVTIPTNLIAPIAATNGNSTFVVRGSGASNTFWVSIRFNTLTQIQNINSGNTTANDRGITAVWGM